MYHLGVDIAAEFNSTVYPISDGVVLSKSNKQPTANTKGSGWTCENGTGTKNYALLIRHKLRDGTNFIALYGHMKGIGDEYKIGDNISTTNSIGIIGNYPCGGDHLITLPIFRAIAKDRPIGMVHFDAHMDTADDAYDGEKYHHGTPFRRAVEEELLDPKRTIQIGIRGSITENNNFSESSGMRVVYIEEFFRIGTSRIISEIRRVIGDGPTYISFDVDGLDPVYAPGTGTPEIGGYTTHDAQTMIRGLRGCNLIGGDVVEVSPLLDISGNTALVGATMMFEILCLLAEVRNK